MSFVYTHSIDRDIILQGDTQISFESISEQWGTKQMLHDIKYYGIIKTMIVDPHIAIGFAGNNIALAAELINFCENTNNIDSILNKALSIHQKAYRLNNSFDNIEFLICYAIDDKRKIFVTKDGLCLQCPSAFIGSEIVNQEVRRLMKAEDMYTTISIWKIKDLVTSAIESGIDKTVGKYVTAIVYNNIEQHFQYVEYYYANSGLPTQRIGPGECIKFKLGAEKGSYNYQIYESNRNVALYIHESQIGVVYTSDDDDAPYGLKGLLLPHSMEIDQLDFDAFAYYYGATKSISTTGLSPTQEIEEIEKRKKIYSTETVEFMLYSKYLDYMQNSPLLIK